MAIEKSNTNPREIISPSRESDPRIRGLALCQLYLALRHVISSTDSRPSRGNHFREWNGETREQSRNGRGRASETEGPGGVYVLATLRNDASFVSDSLNARYIHICMPVNAASARVGRYRYTKWTGRFRVAK